RVQCEDETLRGRRIRRPFSNLQLPPAPLSFPKIPSVRIRALRQNQGIIRCDDRSLPPDWHFHRQPVQAAAPACSREPLSPASAQYLPAAGPAPFTTACEGSVRGGGDDLVFGQSFELCC